MTAISSLLVDVQPISMEMANVSSAFPSPFPAPYQPIQWSIDGPGYSLAVPIIPEDPGFEVPTGTPTALGYAPFWIREIGEYPCWFTPTSPLPRSRRYFELCIQPRLCRHSAKASFFLGLLWLLALLRLWWTTAWDLVLVGKLWIGRLSRNPALGFIDRSLYR